MGIVDNDLKQFASFIRQWVTTIYETKVPPSLFAAFTDPSILIPEFLSTHQLVTTGSKLVRFVWSGGSGGARSSSGGGGGSALGNSKRKVPRPVHRRSKKPFDVFWE